MLSCGDNAIIFIIKIMANFKARVLSVHRLPNFIVTISLLKVFDLSVVRVAINFDTLGISVLNLFN